MVFNRRGNLWNDVDREFSEMDRFMDRMLGSLRSWDWSQLPANQPIYYGVSMEVGPDGLPHVQHFGNVRPGPQAALENGVREPFVTSFMDEEKHQVRITAEMPGIEKKDVHVEVLDGSLHITAEGEDRHYEKTLPLSVPVKDDSAKARFKNGVLEVTLDIKKPERPKGRALDIE